MSYIVDYPSLPVCLPFSLPSLTSTSHPPPLPLSLTGVLLCAGETFHCACSYPLRRQWEAFIVCSPSCQGVISLIQDLDTLGTEESVFFSDFRGCSVHNRVFGAAKYHVGCLLLLMVVA